MSRATFEFFSMEIKTGVFDARNGNTGSKQLITATDKYVMSGVLSKDEQKDLLREFSDRIMKSINDRHAGLSEVRT